MGKIIGIDLGTTNSLAAVWQNGKSQLIPNAFGEYLTPSVVSVDVDGTVYVGKIAKERLISHPNQTASVFKRFMGTSKTYRLGKWEYRPEELSALILRKLREDAEQYLGEPVEEAIISVPAYFNDMSRKATKDAGKLAGLKVERIINEPSAAALACQQSWKNEDSTLLVFDFGGGTLDVSLVECFDNIIEILAVSGDNHLGGSDFDRVIAEHFCKKHNLVFEKISRESQGILLKSANRLKCELTEQKKAVMTVADGEFQGQLELDRKELIQIAGPLFGRMSAPVRRVLMDAEKSIRDISQVVLVGGSCKMPVVQQYLHHILETEQMITMEPDYMIALGVGTYAGIKERNEEIRDMLLTDICPFSLGTGVYNEADPENALMCVVIERNSALPASREVTLCTVSDYQQYLRIEVFQGEEMYAQNNIKLGTLKIPVPPSPRGEESAVLRYTYDINGILVVDVRIVSTGEERQLVIINEKNTISSEEMDEYLQKLEGLKIHPRDKEENQFMIARGERLYIQATGQMREEIGESMDYFLHLLGKQDEFKIMRWRKVLDAFFTEIEGYLDMLNEPWKQKNFVSWYEEKQAEDEWEIREEYKSWKNGPLTS